jgi:predicted RNA-binding Zn ribbon-like protein
VVTKRATELKIVGGDLALDLANTLEGPEAPETLVDYAELTRWAALVGAIEPDATDRLVWEGDHLRRVLWPIASAAVDLLRTGPLDRIKTCANCPWLFIDHSRNRSRRWCTMDECGVHLKMRRYRARLATEGR